jgi:hypothetical protein
MKTTKYTLKNLAKQKQKPPDQNILKPGGIDKEIYEHAK